MQTTLLTTEAIHMLNENEGYAGGQSGFVYRTTDGGMNWNFHGTIGATLIDITFPPTADTGYACGDNGAISFFTSSGVTNMNSGVNGNLSSISFPINSKEGWVCGGSVIRHFTGGIWVADQIPPSGGYNSIDMVDTLNGGAVGDNGAIINTTDGQNWQTQQLNPAYILTNVFFLKTQEGWAIGSGGTILHTLNGGTMWNTEGAGLANNILRGVHFTSSTNGYVVGNNKTLLQYGEITSVENEEEIPIEFSLLQNYPNPFNPITKIKFTIPSVTLSGVEGSFATLKVYDVIGNEVATLANEEKPAGEYEIEFSAIGGGNGLTSGIYFYQLRATPSGGQAGCFIETKKMILLK